jgi:hypothetical protein
MMHFVAMLICHTSKRGDDLTLRVYFFNNGLIKSLTALDIPENTKPDMFKLISIIMVFLVKRVIFANQWGMIKKFCLGHLQRIKDSKTMFNYVYCLRSILQHETISTQDIIKHKVMEFLHDSLDSPIHQYHAGCAL